MLLNNFFIDFRSFTFYSLRLFNAKIIIYRFFHYRLYKNKNLDISINFTFFGSTIIIKREFITNIIIITFIKIRVI